MLRAIGLTAQTTSAFPHHTHLETASFLLETCAPDHVCVHSHLDHRIKCCPSALTHRSTQTSAPPPSPLLSPVTSASSSTPPAAFNPFTPAPAPLNTQAAKAPTAQPPNDLPAPPPPPSNSALASTKPRPNPPAKSPNPRLLSSPTAPHLLARMPVPRTPLPISVTRVAWIVRRCGTIPSKLRISSSVSLVISTGGSLRPCSAATSCA